MAERHQPSKLGGRVWPGIVVTLLLLVAPAISSGVILTSPSGAAPAKSVGSCRAMQIIQWLGPPKVSLAANHNYEANVYFENIGRTCSLALIYVGVVPTAGGAHHWLTSGSVTPTVALLGAMVMKPGARVSAAISIESIHTASFTQLVRTHGGACDPKLADGLVVLGLYRGWPAKYFALPQRIAVCTSDYRNVAAGVIHPASSSG